ncbi:hypothetical protein COCSUDRAFT_61207 [Coccomyxa subellipsoidea C-169]|uniref:Uncharacterized protein n=1 Tax=Coccomyxa subellipsoidea (strain C-169) TaxID=574566 RepID=I0Z6F7_COCSC|nr:hypothetical protein COCSUDRAFT_61207 [Coccomyxa subellipsoidea C-169]EIE26226.1 hypothetical protein COCSUDRAFT_61207 [Coccomyxa subellipsoidea C-169]|eukprot:XP_005650770.1 hypothetical protein COCSUDRAFT_61207 [Coccomyxa subellipsoidea C-169]
MTLTLMLFPTEYEADPWLLEQMAKHPLLDPWVDKAEEARQYREVSALTTVDWRSNRFSGGHMPPAARAAKAAGECVLISPTNPNDLFILDTPYGTGYDKKGWTGSEVASGRLREAIKHAVLVASDWRLAPRKPGQPVRKNERDLVFQSEFKRLIDEARPEHPYLADMMEEAGSYLATAGIPDSGMECCGGANELERRAATDGPKA